MNTPMAVLEMEPVEVDKEESTDPADWTWEPTVKDRDGLHNAMRMSQQTSRATTSKQMDHGENK